MSLIVVFAGKSSQAYYDSQVCHGHDFSSSIVF